MVYTAKSEFTLNNIKESFFHSTFTLFITMLVSLCATIVSLSSLQHSFGNYRILMTVHYKNRFMHGLCNQYVN